jgi:hypothetical protein
VVTDLPTVALWADATTQWTVVGELPVYTSLSFQPRFNDTGTWQISVPWDEKAKKADTEQLVTIDWRGVRAMTGVITSYERAVAEDGNPVLNLSGLDALAYVGYSLAWPQPALGIASQTLWDPDAAPPIRTTAGAAVVQVVRDNLITRRALNVTVPASTIGTTVSVRPAFDNLLELALRKANRGGIGVKATMEALGADGVNATAGLFTVRCYLPADKSVRIVFDGTDGSAGPWTRTRTAPTASRDVVSGVQGKYRTVARTATGWNPTREKFTQGPASFDDVELDQAADEDLDAGAPVVNASITVAETPSQQAFTHYGVSDTATAILGAQSLVGPITAIDVTVDESGPTVKTVFGDPDGIDPRDAHAKLLRRTRRDVDQQKRRT